MKPGRRTRRGTGRRPGRLVATLVTAAAAVTVVLAPTVPPATAGAATRRGPAAPPSANWGASVTGASACNPLGGSTCMAPFPSDYYTVVDHKLPSGRHVVFPKAAMPTNVVGLHITPATYGRNDGFSPGSSVLVHVAGINLARSHIPGVGHVGTSLKADAGVVLVDETTGQRLPYWGELDARDSDPSTQLLMIHPAANFPEGHRIAVVVAGAETAAGKAITPSAAFAAVLGRRAAPTGVTPAFLRHERSLVSYLRGRGVDTKQLTVAWDFTVISTKNLTGYAIHMRDVAMAQLGGGAPSFSVTGVTNFTPAQNGSDSRQVNGTFTVPSFLDEPGGPFGSTLNLGPTGLPQQLPGNTQQAAFSCLIPRTAAAAGTGGKAKGGRPVLYGVGLFNVATKIGDENV